MQNLDKADLSGLESQIDALLRNASQLRVENKNLRNKVTQLENELKQFDEKNKRATTEINRIITQLKEEME